MMDNTLIPSRNEIKSELCKRSFYYFLQEFWDIVIPETPVFNWHIKYLCDELQYLNSFVVDRKPRPYDLIINISPGSTKSTIVTQMYNAWVWTTDPSQRFITTSYSHYLALAQSVKTRDIILSDKYRAYFPNVAMKADQSGKSDFWNTSGGQRFTTSTGGTITGIHAHQIIIDDPINPKQAVSDVERESANAFISSTLSSRKIDKEITPTILIMQRLHEDDPTGMLLSKNKKIKHINLPAEDNGNIKPPELAKNYVDGLMDPIRLSRTILAEAKVDLGSYGYAGQYDQDPSPKGGGLIKKDWFPIIDWKQEYNNLTWHFVADTAYTTKEENDPSGYLSYAKTGNEYIIRFAQTERLEFPELCEALQAFAHLHGYTHRSMVEVEPKASGKSLVQTLRRETNLNVKEGIPPSKDKVSRVKDTSPIMESGRVSIIRGGWNRDFLDQLTTFPNAKHDEYVDCVTMMLGKENKQIKYGRSIRPSLPSLR